MTATVQVILEQSSLAAIIHPQHQVFMDPRASGYITEIGYPHDYQQELAPALLSLAALNGGTLTHTAKPLRYLELGFGQGLSLAIHAAACPGEYWGTDINAAHVAN